MVSRSCSTEFLNSSIKLAKLVVEMPAGGVADGKTPVKIVVKLSDAAGVPVTVRTPVTLAASLGAWQLRQLAPQVFRALPTHRGVPAAHDREPHRAIEGREIAPLQAPRLAFFETQPHEADPVFDRVLEWDPIPIEVHGLWQRIEPCALRLRDDRIHIELESRGQEVLPGAHSRELRGDPFGHTLRRRGRQG